MDVIKLFGNGFPLTVERLEFLQQTYTRAFNQFSTILGDHNLYIISGIEVTQIQGGIANLTAGVMVINGEILPFSGGQINADTPEVIIAETSIEVPYNIDADNDGDLDLKPADTTRVATLGDATGESYDFNDFRRLPQIERLLPTIGDVKMIARDYDPSIDIGWQLLDMGDRFPVGAGDSFNVNSLGGSNEKNISINNVPAHNHSASFNIPPHTHNIPADGGSTNTSSGTSARRDTGNNGTIQTAPAGAQTINFNTETVGGGEPLNITPKYRAFNFLIFVGI